MTHRLLNAGNEVVPLVSRGILPCPKLECRLRHASSTTSNVRIIGAFMLLFESYLRTVYRSQFLHLDKYHKHGYLFVSFYQVSIVPYFLSITITMGLWFTLKTFAGMAANFPKRTVLPTPKSHVPLQLSRPAINAVLSTPSSRPTATPGQEVESKSPNGNCKTLHLARQGKAGSWSYREHWRSATDAAYDAECMKSVIESQKVCIFRDGKAMPQTCMLANRSQHTTTAPYSHFYYYPEVYYYDPSRRWVGM